MLRIAKNNVQRERAERMKTTASYGSLPTLNSTLPEATTASSAVTTPDASFRVAQQRERLRRQVGSSVPLFPQPAEEGDEDMFATANGYAQAADTTYATAMLGRDGRAASAIRGEVNAYADKATDEAMKALKKKAQDVGQRWVVSIVKNALAVTEIPPWAAWIVEVLTYLYDCIRAVVTIFVPDATIDLSRGGSQVAADVTKKTIRTFFPPFSLSDPAGLIGFITQSLILFALVTIAIFCFCLVLYVLLGFYELISAIPLIGG